MEEFEEAILLSVWTRNFGSDDQIAEQRNYNSFGVPFFRGNKSFDCLSNQFQRQVNTFIETTVNHQYSEGSKGEIFWQYPYYFSSKVYYCARRKKIGEKILIRENVDV